jgi:hypothetical protein
VDGLRALPSVRCGRPRLPPFASRIEYCSPDGFANASLNHFVKHVRYLAPFEQVAQGLGIRLLDWISREITIRIICSLGHAHRLGAAYNYYKCRKRDTFPVSSTKTNFFTGTEPQDTFCVSIGLSQGSGPRRDEPSVSAALAGNSCRQAATIRLTQYGWPARTFQEHGPAGRLADVSVYRRGLPDTGRSAPRGAMKFCSQKLPTFRFAMHCSSDV